ncbi:MAG TPA: hypothetical protein PLO19_04870 [Candidatus Cryosericum sp.]|nr:hypothetical protein [Candidatus Cryosericum sp.]
MTKSRTTVIKVVAMLSVCAVILGTALFLSSNQKATSIIQSTAFVPKQSLVVGSTARLAAQAQDVRGKTVSMTGRKVLVFSDKSCGSCLYLAFPIIEWVQKFKDTGFYYIEKTDQIPLIDGELRSYQNFHIISDSNSSIFKSFGEPSTPSVFFLDADNRIVWKSTGFLMSDYVRYEQRIKEFSEGRSTFDDYQENIDIGNPFPKIAHSSNGVATELPDDFLGKPTLMFFLYASSKASKVKNVRANRLGVCAEKNERLQEHDRD